ncbi:hypothetical protein KCP75_00725 [Salmonella enterica subsp. enterica]|nr:hypothetical protein KCP75_00725 [Salmonella enterica subsp. enterica]
MPSLISFPFLAFCLWRPKPENSSIFALRRWRGAEPAYWEENRYQRYGSCDDNKSLSTNPASVATTTPVESD